MLKAQKENNLEGRPAQDQQDQHEYGLHAFSLIESGLKKSPPLPQHHVSLTSYLPIF